MEKKYILPIVLVGLGIFAYVFFVPKIMSNGRSTLYKFIKGNVKLS